MNKPTKSRAKNSRALVETVASASVNFPIVGIGASAGGLAAFEAFFSGMANVKDPGMAIVLVQHLAPDHKSILAELICRYTRMNVYEVEDGMTVQANSIYIIPPNRDMSFLNGALQLLEPTEKRGQRLPIDYFFRTLAEDQHERAIGIVLSGTGSDGTLGIRAIKGEGGMAMVQRPDTTEFDGMPQSAIATGLVDYVLPAAEMAGQLISYTSSLRAGAVNPVLLTPKSETALKKIFVLLRSQTGHDFSLYKPSTIYRRIERRMAVHQIDTMDSYVKYLQQNKSEVMLLFRDLLIGVTNFFRDTEAFGVLENQVIPKLFSDKPAGGLIRVWTPGCSTGEEPYSIAILIAERMEALKQSFTVQIFATDIDSEAIATARTGIYPNGIVANVSPERLARFFTAEPGGHAYRIHKSIRDMLVFSEQDVVKDPPFSKMDLISCRNLLIYMGGELQKKLIPLFHYALKPGGTLFLGTSESIGEFSDLFSTLDRKAKVYQRNGSPHGSLSIAGRRLSFPIAATDSPALPEAAKRTGTSRRPLRELTEQALLLRVAPASVLVNSRGDILYLHGRTGMFLEPATGEAGVNNILKMAREGLRRDLTVTLREATKTLEITRCPRLRVKTNGHFTNVNLTIHPLAADPAEVGEKQLYLVVLEEAPPEAIGKSQKGGALSKAKSGRPSPGSEARYLALKEELRAKEQYLQSANEELQSSAEELKSSNEEMQSVNEELQSTNEELETSKEELQSVNEELSTVNVELQTKVADLSRSNNDMTNLLAGTGIATVFVDHQLRIMRFTPSACLIINLIHSDVGRPVGHLVSNLVGYTSLVADTQSVLKTLVPKEVEVQTQAGSWYCARIQPYRTTEHVIEGAVITFVDITEVVRVREALQKANDLHRLAIVLRDASDAIIMQDLDGRIMAWNPAAVRLYGWSEGEALQMNVRDRIPLPLRKEALAMQQRLSRAEVIEPSHTQRIAKSGKTMEVSIVYTALLNENGQVYAVATTERGKGQPS